MISEILEIRRTADNLYDIQEVRMRTENRMRQFPKEKRDSHVSGLLETEKQHTKRLEVLLEEYPIYTKFLKDVKGVGPRISGSLIAHIMVRFERISNKEYKSQMERFEDQTEDTSHLNSETQGSTALYTLEQLRLAMKGAKDKETGKKSFLVPTIRGIGEFATVSKMWAWFGLHVVAGKAPKKVKNEEANWSHHMRVVAWKTAKQFVMQGDSYREVYDKYKERITKERMPLGKCRLFEECKSKLVKVKNPSCKGHIDNMAMRYAVKRFLCDMWLKWRELEGLPVTEPYVFARLDHTGKVAHEK